MLTIRDKNKIFNVKNIEKYNLYLLIKQIYQKIICC